MNKKNLKIFVMLLIAVLCMALVACGNNNTNSTVKNAEFEEYEKIATTVIDSSLKNGTAKSAKAQASAAALPMSFTQSTKDKILTYLDGLENKKSADNSSDYNDIFEQSFYLPLVCGDAIRKFYNSDKFYNITILIEGWDQYVKTVSEGSHKISYVYSADPQFNVCIMMDIDYKSESDFTFKSLQFNADLSETLFWYGNSSREFLAIFNRSDKQVLYTRADGAGYVISDQSAIDYCYGEVAAEFAAIDQSPIKALANNPQYTITEEQFDESLKKYSLYNEEVKIEWTIADGILYGYHSQNAPKELTLPADVSAIYYKCNIDSAVERLVIPENIKSIKIEKDELDYLENPNAVDSGDSTLVDCPTKYFSIGLRDHGTYLKEIELKGNSNLFKVDNHCLYDKDGTLLYITENAAITSLTLDGNKMSWGLQLSEMRGLYLPNLKNVDSTIGYIENEQTGPSIIDPFALLTNDLQDKKYSFEQVVIRGISGKTEGLTFGDYNHTDGLTIGRLDLYGTHDANDLRRLDINVDCSVRQINIKANLGEVSLNINQYGNGGSLDEIVISDDINRLSLSYFNQEKMARIVLPWTQLEFEMLEKYKIFRENMTESDYKGLGWGYDSTEHNWDNSVTLVFQPLSDDESEFIQNFARYQVFEGKDEKYIRIEGYWGEDSVIRIPESLSGIPVTYFELSNYYVYGDTVDEKRQPTVNGVKELYLPNTLTTFSRWQDINREAYSLDKIVYDGTKAQFEKILDGATINYILSFTKKIECSDGVIYSKNLGQYGNEKIIYKDASANVLTVQIDWENANGDLGEVNRSVVYANYTYLGVTLVGHAQERLVLNEGDYTLTINVYTDRSVEIVFFTGQGQFSEFQIESVGEAAAPIKHTLQTRVIDPTCDEQGCTETYCTYCLAVTSRTDIKPKLEHKLEGEKQIIAPSCTNGGYIMQHCILCKRDCLIEGSETKPLGHLFDDNGHCTRQGCQGIKGDGVETQYLLQASTGEVVTVYVALQGFSTENGELIPTIKVVFQYKGLNFGGKSIGGSYYAERDGNSLSVTAKDNDFYATLRLADGTRVEFTLMPKV